MELGSQYLPQGVEEKIYELWIKSKAFEAKQGTKKNFTILMPPPNVTGVLHMGHALTFTLEDILVRRKRMQGYEALWIPGTDHAGIATQMVVERKLQEKKISRHDLGREKFLAEVWKWKEESQTTILSQIRTLGCSVDWSRLRFTLDDQASKAVREAFVRLFREGLIYRDEAMIQWCPRCRTALSDLEVKFAQRKGKLWKIKYRLKSDLKQSVIVATTRPETLLGDTAVAVNPEDVRYKAFQGKKVLVPLVNREIPIVCDDYVDKSFGTGALKITPGHDPADYQLGKKHGLKIISIFDDGAKLNSEAGTYQGLSREKAREKILEDLQKEGFLESATDHTSNVGACDRCQSVVEPRVSFQWFVKADVLAGPAIQAVRSKKIRIVPPEWEKTYFEWLENIRPWCISRQLWWGHRIPVWTCDKCKHVFAATEDPKHCEKCTSTTLKQEDDVLDTWFSSGLWPLSTLGWPEETPDLKSFYPSNVMETGFDILFFWVARMVMLSMHFKNEVPFEVVYLHPMVRDEFGQKMSKTKGNVKDPLEIIQTKGADSLRFTLCAMAVHGRDVQLSDNRIEGYRNFINKVWNASRFILMHFGDIDRSSVRTSDPINQWILTRLNNTKREVKALWDEYRFFEAASVLYHFVWNDTCDYFIEFIKRKGELASRKATLDSTAVEVLEEILRLLHPIIPFVTEELWQHFRLKAHSNTGLIATAPYPESDLVGMFPEGEKRVSLAISVIEAIRKIRGEHNIARNTGIEVRIFAEENVKSDIRPMMDLIADLTQAERLTLLSPNDEANFVKEPLVAIANLHVRVRLPSEASTKSPSNTNSSAQGTTSNTLDSSAGTIRELEVLRLQLTKISALLQKPGFADKAPAAVVAKEREKESDLKRKIEALEKLVADSKE